MRVRLPLFALLFISSVFAACSGGSPPAGAPADGGGGSCVVPSTGSGGTGTLTGEGPYSKLVSTKSVYGLVQNPFWSVTLGYTDYEGACGYSLANLVKAGANGVTITIGSTGTVSGAPQTTPPELTPGTYTIANGSGVAGATKFVVIGYPGPAQNTVCGGPQLDGLTAASGTVTFTSVSPTLSGSLDVTFANPIVAAQYHVQATFADVANCEPTLSHGPICCGDVTVADGGGASDATPDAAPPRDAAGPDADHGAGVCPPAAFAALPAGYSVDGISRVVWDKAGLVFHAISDPRQGGALGAPGLLVSIPVSFTGNKVTGGLASGPAVTLFTLPAANVFGNLYADASTVYFTIDEGSAKGLYSVPRAGGTPKLLYSNKNIVQYWTFASDGTTIYLADAVLGSWQIEAIPVAGGSSKVVYTAPSGQAISNLALAGSLYWTEADHFVQLTPTTVRFAAPSQTALVPSTLGTVNAATAVNQLVIPFQVGDAAQGDTVFFSGAGLSLGKDAGTPLSGIYKLSPGSAPTVIDPNGTILIAYSVFSDSGLVYEAPPGIKAYDWAAGKSPTVVTSVPGGFDALGFNEDFVQAVSPQIAYSLEQCFYAVAGP